MSKKKLSFQIAELESLLKDCGQSFCVQVNVDGTVEVHPLSSFGGLLSSGSKVLLGFSDPSPLVDAPGWPLRRLLREVVTKW
jgi:Ubiquitin-like modifier-activating enzyme ATG7 N-terminus